VLYEDIIGSNKQKCCRYEAAQSSHGRCRAMELEAVHTKGYRARDVCGQSYCSHVRVIDI
jgi:hypothetical protein